jgi:uncharacterized membrane protein (GlpM family)
MDNIFLLKLFLSFIVGSFWITTGTVLAEKHGTKIGGLVAGLPSTILISLFFIAWTQSTRVAVEATTIVPIIGGINCLFIVAYIFLLRINFWLALSGSLLVWLLFSSALVLIKFSSLTLSLIAYICLLIISYYVVERKLQIKSESGKKIRYTSSIMIFRGLFSGFIIALTVVLAKIGGPLLGGMFAMFPAMFIGTLFITYFAHGASFSSAVMKASILGAIGVVIYGVAVRYTYLPFGLWAGTFISIIISYGGAFLVHHFIAGKAA